jgi:transcriptional regulator with XRE-family HTH domain
VVSSANLLQRALEVRAQAATRLRQAQAAEGYSVASLGHAIGIKPAHAHRVLSGSAWPSLPVLLKLALVLEIPLSHVLLPEELPPEACVLAAQFAEQPAFRTLAQRLASWRPEEVARLTRLVTLLPRPSPLLDGFIAMLEATSTCQPSPGPRVQS